jgi:hypothetical protein
VRLQKLLGETAPYFSWLEMLLNVVLRFVPRPAPSGRSSVHPRRSSKAAADDPTLIDPIDLKAA